MWLTTAHITAKKKRRFGEVVGLILQIYIMIYFRFSKKNAKARIEGDTPYCRLGSFIFLHFIHWPKSSGYFKYRATCRKPKAAIKQPVTDVNVAGFESPNDKNATLK